MRRIIFQYSTRFLFNCSAQITGDKRNGAATGAKPPIYLAGSVSLLYRDVMTRIVWPQILRARTNQAVIVQLFKYVRGPAADPRNRKNRGKQILVDAQRVVGRGGIKINIRIKLFVRFDELLDFFRHVIPLRLPAGLAQIARHGAQMRGSRILGVIYTMAK